MRGLMMDDQLLISSIINYAADYHGDAEIVSRTVEGGIHRYGYRDAAKRANQLARSLSGLGIGVGDRVATMAWNGYRHYELFFGVTGIGAICHTLNPRLFDEQIKYIVNHAQDRILLFDVSCMPLIERLAADFRTVEHYVAMTDRAHMPQTVLPNVLCYEELIATESDDFDWPKFDERTASTLCYTSGTTGDPKGVLHSHRSIVLCAFAGCMTDVLRYSMHDVVCPVTPMFHGNSWGSPYGATMAGAKLVLPGQHVDGASLYSLMEGESVTMGLAVPTVWQNLLDHAVQKGRRFATLKRALTGGTAPPLSMIKTFERLGVDVVHAWGMTEMSPAGAVGTMTPKICGMDEGERDAYRVKQGHGIYGVELKLSGNNGERLPHDGRATGELLARGPLVAGAYFNNDSGDTAFDNDGWLRTGDIATIDSMGYLTILDRRKDIIKSGGEWISSIAIENATIGHPDVREAAVIGVQHPKWGERPLLIIVPRDLQRFDKKNILTYLAGRVAKWQLPNDIVAVSELPYTATGKIHKVKLREAYRDHKIPAD